MEEEKTVEELNEELAASSEATEETSAEQKKPFLTRLAEWWERYKPSKRRLIQVYAALLYNANIKGYITGNIFTGVTKTVCVPGLNCYSCPGAIGACPLGALQNALASSNKRAPYYMLGIILLYGLIFGRMICGFLCPVGLGQDLLYNIKTPKVGKSRVTKILSYFKYVILAVLVIGIPLIYAIDKIVVPGFCKYICPAGTFGGAFMLLINPANDSLYSMLGALFTWKTALLFAIIVACIFIYRAFCRFLCPLGAIYGLFNRFSLLGIAVNDSKCINCGKCVRKCKMDIKKVGDHECINCGECREVCPTKAISFRGSKIFVDNIDKSVKSAPVIEKQGEKTVDNVGFNGEIPACKSLDESSVTLKKGKAFWFRVVALILMAALFIGTFTYINFFAKEMSTAEAQAGTYIMSIGSTEDIKQMVSFTFGDGKEYIVPEKGSGTEEDPFIISSPVGKYAEIIEAGERKYYQFTLTEVKNYEIVGGANLDVKIFFTAAGAKYASYDYLTDGKTFEATLTPSQAYGNAAGFVCYDFTLNYCIGEGTFTLSDYRGQVVVINFWYTQCGPCVKELPFFEEVRKAHEETVFVAIHNVGFKDEAPQFLVDEGWTEWGIQFIQDSGEGNNNEIFTLLGGRNNAYPRTLVVDKEGVVRYVFEGSVSEEKLTAAVETCLAE